jgi:hypothetical protein
VGLLTAAALLGLVIAWTAARGGPAIYDGLPIGTPPYRYLDPPPGTPKTPPPSTVSAHVVLADNPAGVSLSTKEPKPQADVSVPTQLLIVPAGVTTVTVSVGPVQPPPAAPSDGRIDGNVYRIDVLSPSGQHLVMQPGAGSVFPVRLRGTGSLREPHVESYANGVWTRLAFTHPETGIFSFQPSQPGRFALVLPPGHSIFGPGLTAGVAIGGALLVVGGVLAVIRRRRLADVDDVTYDGESEDGKVDGDW